MELLQNMGTGRRVRERGLQQRGGRWHLRVAVPSDLVGRLGRREITASLGTGEYKIARYRVRQAWVLLDELFETMRHMPELGRADLEQLARKWFVRLREGQERKLVERGEATADSHAARLERTETGLAECQQFLAMNQVSQTRPAAERLLAEIGRTGDEAATASLARLLLRGAVAVAELAHASVRGDYGAKPSDPLFADLDGTVTVTAGSHTLGELVDRYLDEMKPAVTAASLRKVQGVLSLLKRIYGPQVQMAAFTTASIQHYKSTLSKLPANAVKRYGDLPIDQLLAKGAADGAEPMSRENANSHIQKALGFLEWCRANGYMAKLEVDGKIKFQTASDPMGERSAFSSEQITLLFSSPVFTGCKSVSRRSETGKYVFRDDRYWLPLLGLYTGARLSELASLRPADVKKGHQEDGAEMWWIELNPDSYGRKMKTKLAQRAVPLHPELIRLGFIKYFEAQAKAKHDRLFPECAPSRPDGNWSDKPSKWFSKYLEVAGIRGVSFHSLRHSFDDCLKDGDAEDSEIAELMGHKMPGMTFGRYGGPRQAARLYRALLKGRFPVLQHLQPM